MTRVLIPLVQGRFLFNGAQRMRELDAVLIPLVQGRFLFTALTVM